MDLARGKRRRKTAASQTQAIMGPNENSLPSPDGAAGKQLSHVLPHKLLEEQHSHLLPKIDPALQAMPVVQPGESMLESLPNELLAMAVAQLAPADSSLENTEAYKANKANLRNLCLVSKELEAVARPALYRDVRLYKNITVVRLYAALCANTTLARHVKSVLLNIPKDPRHGDIGTIDMTPLRPFQDVDYAFWTQGKTKRKCRMPQTTRGELICMLFCKVLSRVPTLESLYFKLPDLDNIRLECLRNLPFDTQFANQLRWHHHQFRQFIQGNTLPNLSNLKTVGILEMVPNYFGTKLCTKLFGLQSVHSISWDGVNGSWGDEWPEVGTWHRTMDNATLHSFSRISYACISTSVRSVVLRDKQISTKHITKVSAAFPSLESLTIDSCCFDQQADDLSTEHCHSLFRVLGELENLNTLVLGTWLGAPDFVTAISTATGPSNLFNLSALSKLRTLVVSANHFVCFTQDDEADEPVFFTADDAPVCFTQDDEPVIHRATTILPDSLRWLTLLLSEWEDSLSWAQRMQRRRRRQQMPRLTVSDVVESFLRDIAPALLVDFPHLERVDLGHNMKDYRQHNVQTLAERSTADGGAVL